MTRNRWQVLIQPKMVRWWAMVGQYGSSVIMSKLGGISDKVESERTGIGKKKRESGGG